LRSRSPKNRGPQKQKGKRKRNLSKFLSLILRHRPNEFGLEPDEKGFVPFDDLLKAVQATSGWKWVRKSDVTNIVEGGEKKRFEIVKGSIRALYGHSIPAKLDMERVEAPEYLYHGTIERLAREALEKGLIPKNRQYVLLTESPDEAIRIALRRVSDPAVVIVHAKKAGEAGTVFYRGSDGSFLAEKIPSDCCEYNLEDSKGEVFRHRLQRWLDVSLTARRYVEQEDALEELLTFASEDEVQRTFLEALENEDPVKRANAATSLIPDREETLLRLLERVEIERSVVVLRNLAIALELLPVKERFEGYRPRVVRALERIAACEDDYASYRAAVGLAHVQGRELKVTEDRIMARPDMTDEEARKTIDELPTPAEKKPEAGEEAE
jgi:putative RNA 2'-phosphotransferase